METYFELWFEYGVDDFADFVLDKPLYEHFGPSVPFLMGKALTGVFPSTTVNLKSRPKAPDVT